MTLQAEKHIDELEAHEATLCELSAENAELRQLLHSTNGQLAAEREGKRDCEAQALGLPPSVRQ
jgi:septal ring factor EnvC (AmiA/AmiB activator)